MILLDIDYFKKVNDTFGHAVGDTVLKKLTRQIAHSFQRETDWCARLGGEEFVIVLEGTNLENARMGAEKLRMRIANTPIETSAGPVSVTVSMGISGIGDSADLKSTSVEGLLEAADSNLYVSKAAGRNCITWGARSVPALALGNG